MKWLKRRRSRWARELVSELSTGCARCPSEAETFAFCEHLCHDCAEKAIEEFYGGKVCEHCDMDAEALVSGVYLCPECFQDQEEMESPV